MRRLPDHLRLDHTLTGHCSFQKVQHLSATEACVRFAPNALIGVTMNIISGMIAHRTETYWIALAGSCLTALSPLLMVTATVDRPYFFSTFGALLTSSSSCDSKLLMLQHTIAWHGLTHHD